MDRQTAGEEARWRGSGEAPSAGRECRRAPQGGDPAGTHSCVVHISCNPPEIKGSQRVFFKKSKTESLVPRLFLLSHPLPQAPAGLAWSSRVLSLVPVVPSWLVSDQGVHPAPLQQEASSLTHYPGEVAVSCLEALLVHKAQTCLQSSHGLSPPSRPGPGATPADPLSWPLAATHLAGAVSRLSTPC